MIGYWFRSMLLNMSTFCDIYWADSGPPVPTSSSSFHSFLPSPQCFSQQLSLLYSSPHCFSLAFLTPYSPVTAFLTVLAPYSPVLSHHCFSQLYQSLLLITQCFSPAAFTPYSPVLITSPLQSLLFPPHLTASLAARSPSPVLITSPPAVLTPHSWQLLRQTLFEDELTNRMTESITLFEEVCKNQVQHDLSCLVASGVRMRWFEEVCKKQVQS
jgi:hypothetical protein